MPYICNGFTENIHSLKFTFALFPDHPDHPVHSQAGDVSLRSPAGVGQRGQRGQGGSLVVRGEEEAAPPPTHSGRNEAGFAAHDPWRSRVSSSAPGDVQARQVPSPSPLQAPRSGGRV